MKPRLHPALLLALLLASPAAQAGLDCNKAFKRAQELFTRKAEELTPKELAAISEAAQSVDQASHPVARAADLHAQRLLEQYRRQSAATQTRLLIEQAQGVVHRREIGVIGLGAHGSILGATIEALAPGATIIYFEAGDGSSRIFDADFFKLNSSETPTSGDTPLSYGPVQLRDLMPPFTGHAYPRDRTLANGLHFLKGSLAGDLLLGNAVFDVERGTDGFIVTTSQGVRVCVRKLVIGVGYGAILVDFLDEVSQSILASSTRRVYETGDLTGAAISFDDMKQAREKFFRARQSGQKGPQPARSFELQLQRNDVLILGGKDGGSVVAEGISELPAIGKRYWFGQEGETGETFIRALENKKRYADLLDEIETGEIQARTVRVIDLEEATHPDGRPGIRVVYKQPDGTVESLIVHTAILAPGYQAAPTGFLHGMQPRYFANEISTGNESLDRLLREREARWRLENPTAAGSITPDLWGVGVLSARATGLYSISRGGSLTVQIARALIRDLVHTQPLRPLASAPGSTVTQAVALTATGAASIPEPKIALAAFRMRLLRLARSHAFGGDHFELEIAFQGPKATLILHGFDPAAGGAFLRLLADDPELRQALRDLAVTSGTLRLQVPVTPGGGLQFDQALLSGALPH